MNKSFVGDFIKCFIEIKYGKINGFLFIKGFRNIMNCLD